MTRSIAIPCLALALLAGCALPRINEAPPGAPLADTTPLPEMKLFGEPDPLPVTRSNVEIARDFMDLSFRLESGTRLPVMTRFEEPVTLALAGDATPFISYELDRLLQRLRTEAGLDLDRLPDGATAAITIEAVPEIEMRRTVPQAACFVLPTRIDWQTFRDDRASVAADWSRLRERHAATVFLPADVSPQEIRDCLHEEIAQALGPLNDLYRLEDSVFNDDNLHSVLTGFDMLMLRLTYDPALSTGMTRDEVAELLPDLLAEANPAGRTPEPRVFSPTPRLWVQDIETALGPPRPGRSFAANRALALARREGWEDTRLGLSYLTAARLASARDGQQALEYFLQANDIYGRRTATQIHAAQVGLQISAFALASGQWEQALAISLEYVPVAERAENAALLSDLLFVQAAALQALGQPEAAREARRESLGWGRYGSRDDRELRERAAEIDRLVPPQVGRASR